MQNAYCIPHKRTNSPVKPESNQARNSKQRKTERMSEPGNNSADVDKKPADSAPHINLKVKGQIMHDGQVAQSADLNAIAFLFDGRRLRADQTPDELEMEDGDEIDAVLHQTGGGGATTLA